VITGQAVAKVVDLIPGVQAVQGDASANVRRGDKTALTIGAAGTTATPGMVKFGGDGRSASASTKLGEVMRGETIDRARLSVRPLPVISAPAPGGQLADATQLGAFVRARISQLQSCYERAGGTDLAGIVALRLTFSAEGSVGSADIVRRSWSGAAAAQTEACLLAIARGWRVPSGADGGDSDDPNQLHAGNMKRLRKA